MSVAGRSFFLNFCLNFFPFGGDEFEDDFFCKDFGFGLFGFWFGFLDSGFWFGEEEFLGFEFDFFDEDFLEEDDWGFGLYCGFLRFLRTMVLDSSLIQGKSSFKNINQIPEGSEHGRRKSFQC